MRPLLIATALVGSLSLHAQAETADGAALIGQDWAKIAEMAKGGEVNFFHWGGSDTINRYIVENIGGRLQAEYGITLNSVPVADAAEVVALIAAEKQVGNVDAGTVDLIWINGENFKAMKAEGLAFCGYVETLPANALVDWTDASIAHDFGVPVEGCEVPWNRAQFAFAHDSATLAEPPQDIAALLDWIKANPGQFTYPAPPDFTGSVFVRHVFYHAAGGPAALMGPFDQAKYDAAAAKTWAILNEIEPFLWRQGKTYPTTVAQLNDLFANGEVALTFNYDAAQFGQAVDAGIYPDTVRSYGLADGTIGNTNYTLIPFNSPNKAAAMVAQDVLLSWEAQLAKADPAVWGAATVLSMDQAGAELAAQFQALPQHPSVVSPNELAELALPELQADWIAAIERGWIAEVGQK
ncbi:ABC transporter substrate-binding protein [Neogemmobacter tilapiae]|uniref:ABC transporter substrate-binding protein n=1 Tax=Neogemmobacter tilapiae TaxID=875041 RepID=A0A918TTZ8_9RHOB|nr:ABC transporter substrate-binding protein [Gemmobacter tilapiae]GHC61126.1 ABC transporter substrate-binding protein [Gemmobacter tilapiae]